MKEHQHPAFLGKNLPFYLRRSTYIHIALFSLTFIGGKIIFEQQERFREKNMELIQASVRVDMVAMPKYTLNELKNISSGVENAKKEEPAPFDKMETQELAKNETKVEAKENKAEKIETGPTFEEANKLKHQNFLNKLKQIGSKKINTDGNQKADSGLNGEKSSDLKSLILAGNKLAKGSSVYGDSAAQDLTAYQLYVSKLPDLVRPHWRLPSFLSEKKLQCRIRVWIALNGEVTRADVYQTSGDSEYDQRAIEAIKASSPFPALSEEFGKRAQNGSIALGFPL